MKLSATAVKINVAWYRNKITKSSISGRNFLAFVSSYLVLVQLTGDKVKDPCKWFDDIVDRTQISHLLVNGYNWVPTPKGYRILRQNQDDYLVIQCTNPTYNILVDRHGFLVLFTLSLVASVAKVRKSSQCMESRSLPKGLHNTLKAWTNETTIEARRILLFRLDRDVVNAIQRRPESESLMFCVSWHSKKLNFVY